MMYIVFFLVDLYKYFYNFVCDAYLNYFSNNRHLDLNIYYVVIYLYYLTLYIFKFFKGNFHYIFENLLLFHKQMIIIQSQVKNYRKNIRKTLSFKAVKGNFIAI